MADRVEVPSANGVTPVMGLRQLSIKLTNPVAAVADGAIIVAWCGGTIDAPRAIGFHILLACVLFGATALLRRRVLAVDVLRISMLVVLGPLGGCVLVILELGRLLRVRASGSGRPVDDSGFEVQKRAGGAWAIWAAMRQGRRPVPSLSRPSRFVDIFGSGDLARQNATIAAISRHYRPEMLPALMSALNSPVPSVRVQAAAVYAKLRNHYGERAKALLAATECGGGEKDSATLAAECANVAASGFLDNTAAANLQSRAQVLARLDGTYSGANEGPACNETEKVSDPINAPPRMVKRYSCGGLL